MASIIPGYNCDIFISYRQNDNKYDGWVTEFVDNLNKELEANIKDKISIYFDINPHDGLLETHSVDQSLEDKLKCLIFIPIISRTYCDPNSFAWQNEFCVFNKLAQEDSFGRDIKLSSGNVTSRILPVKIHDIDQTDKTFLEKELRGALRSIEFIYREHGVNRPLTSDDDEKINLNRTKYRNQINKLTLAVKEIIQDLLQGSTTSITGMEGILLTEDKQSIQQKSIIVLPFQNMSSDPEQEYFSDGLTEEIITDLSHINDLLVISRSSAMTFKGSNKKIKDIANEVNVKYVLEGSVRKSGNNLRITGQLIDAESDTHIWAKKYNGTLEDIFDIQEKVSRTIVDALKIKLNPEELKRISEVTIDNISAYEYYYKAKQAMGLWSPSELKKAEEILLKGLEIIGENTLLYSLLGYINYQYWNLGYEIDEKCLDKGVEYLNKIFDLEPDSKHCYFLKGTLEMAGGTFNRVVHNYLKVLSSDPNHTEALAWICIMLGFLGKASLATPYFNRLARIDPLNWLVSFIPYIFKIFSKEFEISLEQIREFHNSNTTLASHYSYILCNAYLLKREEAIFAIEKFREEMPESILYNKLYRVLKSALLNEKTELVSLDPDLEKWAEKDGSYSYHIAQCYSLVSEKEKALDWMEISINLGWINYPLLNNNDPLLENIRGEERFKKLMERVKYEWENIKV